MALVAMGNALTEVAGHIQDAVARLAVHGFLCLLHIGGIAHDGDLLCGIHAADKVAAHGGAVVINHHDSLVTHHLGVVDEGI